MASSISAFTQEAQNEGYSQAEINQYLQSKGINQPTQPNAFEQALPTIGGVAGNIAGNVIGGVGAGASEVVGLGPEDPAADAGAGASLLFGNKVLAPTLAGAGQASGQAIEDLLTGKTPGWDVAGQGALGLTSTLFGQGLASLTGKALSSMGAGEALNGLNLTGKQIAQFTANHGGQSALNLLDKYNLLGVDNDGLNDGISTVNQTYNKLADTKNPANLDSFINNVNTIKTNLLGNGSQIVPTAAKDTWDKISSELESQVYPKLGISTDDTGNLIKDGTKTPTMSDVLTAKKNYDSITTNAQFSADPEKWGVNRTIGSILRNTLNDSGSSILKQTGQDMNGLIDLSDMAQKRLGIGQSMFGVGNFLKKGAGAVVGGLLGAHLGVNPELSALGGAAAEHGVESALSNPAVATPLSKILLGTGGKIGGKIGVGLAGATTNIGANAFSNLLQGN